MGWEDRDYYRGDGGGGGRPPMFGGGGFGRFLQVLFFGSFPIGTYLGIRVRVHITFALLIGFQLLFAGDPIWTLRWSSLLFISVLLHEFGHCLACRRVGGFADDILMWPLGGLAFCAPPKRPWPEFVTVAGGPLVNVILMAACFAGLFAMTGRLDQVSLNPFDMWGAGWFLGGFAGVLRDFYLVNYTLLLFNLFLVFYPFDGGRLVQVALWAKFGYYKSMKWATAIGMAGAGGIAVFGLINRQFFLVLIGVFGFITCYRQSQMIAAGQIDDGPTYDPGFYNQRDEKTGYLTRKKLERQRKAAEKSARQEAADQAEVNRVLDKVLEQGLNSLSAREKRILQQDTDRKRNAG
ncbi:MAG: site-2 protease family protein [Planctomycetota bacterium]